MVRIDRVLERLDSYLASKEYGKAEDHLKYWLSDAEGTGDKYAYLTIVNELMGFYRRGGNEDEALRYAALGVERYASDGDISGTVFYATTCLNAATVFNAFGMPEKALDLYRKCLSVYSEKLEPDDLKFAGLYNNMGLAEAASGNVPGARELFEKAVALQEPYGNSTALDRAVTLLNICDICDSDDEIDPLIEKAYALINDPEVPRDAYYAFVCEKCAPVFGGYGYFIYKNKLTEETEKINASYKAAGRANERA